MRCGHGLEFKSGPAKPVAMLDSRSGLAGAGFLRAYIRVDEIRSTKGSRFKVQRLGERGQRKAMIQSEIWLDTRPRGKEL